MGTCRLRNWVSLPEFSAENLPRFGERRRHKPALAVLDRNSRREMLFFDIIYSPLLKSSCLYIPHTSRHRFFSGGSLNYLPNCGVDLSNGRMFRPNRSYLILAARWRENSFKTRLFMVEFGDGFVVKVGGGSAAALSIPQIGGDVPFWDL